MNETWRPPPIAGGNDVVRRVPRDRLRYVERSVEELEEAFDSTPDRAKDTLDELRD